jgi:hypothetical protein
MSHTSSLSSEERFERFIRLLPAIDDPALVVLKGHLLIEELLNDIIENCCGLQQYVGEAKLTFIQKTMLTRALVGKNLKGVEPDEPWRSLEVSNSLRNQLAHHIEPKDLDKKIDMLTFSRFGGKVMVEFKSDLERSAGLMKELSMLGGYLHGYWVSHKSNKEKD